MNTWWKPEIKISLKHIYLSNMLCLVVPEYDNLYSYHRENQKFEVMDIQIL